MSSQENIKIPYATEGIIRTAALDDTIAPENSVQIAVNMNFDRIGAIQTRPGIQAYAEDLGQGIVSFGSLNVQTDRFEEIAIASFSIGAIAAPLVIAKPSGLEVDDMMIACIGGELATWTAPSGWTLLLTQNGTGGNSKAAVYYKIADAADILATDFTWTDSSTDGIGGIIYRITGADITTPPVVEVDTSTSFTPSYDVTITPEPNNLLIMFINNFTNGSSPATSNYEIEFNDPTWTEDLDQIKNGGGYYYENAVAHALRAQNTPTGDAYVDLSGSGGTWSVGFLISVGPAPSISGTDFLFTQIENGDVYAWNGVTQDLVRSGLNPAHKARFAQFLNLTWMVNGNEFFNGDPVQTSQGGVFGGIEVPFGFPKADFINAGFEGRIWVADKSTGVVYFTDIVQFTPPAAYSLTYDGEINYIKNFSPQDGQSITGFFRTPRALLLFRENSIFRIYGATSVDAYPAYNVGTFSQESIVQTKDGCYFHHSSGFYKFNYDGQPIEISRRVIDFVKAIPRTYYEDIKGIYDGFDNVEWYVGPVTVEGVTYTNCVMRFSISTQVWTIYDYTNNNVGAFILYDDGTEIVMLMGTSTGEISQMDIGNTDRGNSIYFEMIDRWRSYLEMYSKVKQINGLNLYTENAAGTNVMYQIQKSQPNKWEAIDTITEENNSLFPNAQTEDFDVCRIRWSGNTRGTPIVFHGMEILKIDDKGFEKN